MRKLNSLLCMLALVLAVSCNKPDPVGPDDDDTTIVDPGEGDNPGGDNPGGDNPGGDNPGGDNPGGDNPGGDNPRGDNPGGDNPGGDNPGGDNPGGDGPEPDQGLKIEVLDPGKTPEDKTYTPGHPEFIHEVAYNDFYNSVQDELDEFGNVDYVCSQGNGTAWPIITSEGFIRLYQGSSASKGGSYIRVRSKNGAHILSVTIGTATSTKIAYTLNGRPSTQSATSALAAGEKLTVEPTISCTEVCFICMGTSQSERMEVNYLSVKYQGGFVEDDFYVPQAEYGPLVKVVSGGPLKEDFETDFPTTDKPTYYKYGLTAGRENLKWDTWFGSFSWQKPISGDQSAQLRVYQEDSEYEKPQFGHLKMEFFLKDLSKVSFKYYFSEFWVKATISYIEWDTEWKSVELKGSQQISLSSYSERQTVRNFTYVLDNGKPHDAKIVIDLDPATGHPTSGHYDIYFDDFVFE